MALTWSLLATDALGGAACNGLAVAVDGTLVAQTGGSSVWRSTDNGATWTEVALPGAQTGGGVIKYLNGRFCIPGWDGSGGYVDTSTTGDVGTWTRNRIASAATRYAGAITFDGTNLVIACVSSAMAARPLQVSADDGATWTAAVATPANVIKDLASDGAGRVVAVEYTGGVEFTDDEGATWSTAATPPAWQGDVVIHDGTKYWATSNGAGGRISSSPTGDVWTDATPADVDDEFFSITPGAASALCAVGASVLGGVPASESSTDAGATWAQDDATAGSTAGALRFNAVVYCAARSAYIAGDNWGDIFVTVSATVPGAPTSVTAVGGDTQATLAWTAPASDGGSAITGYEIKTYAAGVLVNTTTVGVVLTATRTGLTNGTVYSFTVAAINAVGTGAATPVVCYQYVAGGAGAGAGAPGSGSLMPWDADTLEASPQTCRAALEQLLPHGDAWPRDPDTALMLLVRGLALEGARVKQRALALLEELDPRTTTELLPDWERVYAITPDAAATTSERRSALHAKMLGSLGQSETDYRAIAAALGFLSVTFSYFTPFTCISNCNDSLYNGETGGWRSAWMTTTASGGTVANAALEAAFRAHAQVGTTPLFTFT